MKELVQLRMIPGDERVEGSFNMGEREEGITL